jgi:hypothetical protein
MGGDIFWGSCWLDFNHNLSSSGAEIQPDLSGIVVRGYRWGIDQPG